MGRHRRFDCVVIGAGPAGLAAAIKLSTLGRRVAMLHRPRPGGAGRLESMPHRQLIDLAFPGRDCDLPDGMHHVSAGENWWSGAGQGMPDGWLIDRTVFDDSLLEHARRTGIEVLVRTGAAMPQRTGEGWAIEVGGESLLASHMLDASGRHSTLRSRTRLVTWRQVAVTGLILAPDAPTLWIESLPHGWLWGARHPAGRFALSIFCDPAALRSGPAHLWRTTIAASRLGSRHKRWEVPRDYLVHEVTPTCAAESNARVMHGIGDAGLARDPLASQGLMAAVSDGLAAAIGVHTCLADPARAALVAEFHADTRRMAIARHGRALEAAYHAAPYTTEFWTMRRGERKDPERVIPAIAGGCPIQVSRHWQLTRSAVLVNDWIAEGEVLRSEDSQESFAWLAGRPMRDFLSAANGIRSMPDILQSWVARNLATEHTAPGLFAWFVQRGIFIAGT